jgi:hypothetical protein
LIGKIKSFQGRSLQAVVYWERESWMDLACQVHMTTHLL